MSLDPKEQCNADNMIRFIVMISNMVSVRLYISGIVQPWSDLIRTSKASTVVYGFEVRTSRARLRPEVEDRFASLVSPSQAFHNRQLVIEGGRGHTEN